MSNATQQPKERPILFSGPMVRAILEGPKTQTRRMKGLEFINQNPDEYGTINVGIFKPAVKNRAGMLIEGPEVFGAYSDSGEWGVKCPYGRPGDWLYVKEAWGDLTEGYGGLDPIYVYRANATPGQIGVRWRRSIHMPRAASRILLEITDIRLERVCDISEADAIAEGAQMAIQWMDGRIENVDEAHIYHTLATHKLGFQYIWQSINGPESWDKFVWAISFNRILPSEKRPCLTPCSPSDWRKGGKCDQNGCYHP